MKRVEPGEEVQAVGPHMELFISPRFPVQPLCEQNRLRLLLTEERVGWRQAGFPLGGQSISQHESVIILRPCGSFSMLGANVWGALFYATRIMRRTTLEARGSFDLSVRRARWLSRFDSFWI